MFALKPLICMKTITYLTALIGSLCLSISTYAQTVYAGETSVDKQPLKGLYLTLNGDGRQIEKDWEAQLRTYGRVNASRGTYRVTNADIKDVSPEPINLTSTVKSSKTSATIFAAFDLGSGNYVTPGGTGYNAAETLLKNFAAKSLLDEEIRTAESSFNEAQTLHQRMVKKGESLQRDIDNNAKEKERLLKRIDDNAKELEQLKKDLEANRTDQTNALTELENRRKNVEAVKARKQ